MQEIATSNTHNNVYLSLRFCLKKNTNELKCKQRKNKPTSFITSYVFKQFVAF